MRMWMFLLIAFALGAAVTYYSNGFGKLQKKA